MPPDTGGTTGSVTERLPHIFQLPVNVIHWDAIHGIVKPLCIQKLTDLPHCHWQIQGGQPGHGPPKPVKGASCLFAPTPPQKLLKSFFLFSFESKFGSIKKKNSGLTLAPLGLVSSTLRSPKLLDRFPNFKRHSIALYVNYPYKVKHLTPRSLMTSQVRSKSEFSTFRAW